MVKGGKRFYKDTLCAKSLNTTTSNSRYVSLFKGSKVRVLTVNALMVEYFNIKTPDDNHRYTLRYKDNDDSNNSIGNLEYRIHIDSDSEYKYQPIAHHKGRKVVSKVCGRCGKNKNTNDYHLQKPIRKGGMRTYRNACESCRAARQWDRIKSDPKLLKRFNKGRIKWRNNNSWYALEYGKKSRVNLATWYVNRIAVRRGLDHTVMNEEDRQVLRESISIIREAKKQ